MATEFEKKLAELERQNLAKQKERERKAEESRVRQAEKARQETERHLMYQRVAERIFPQLGDFLDAPSIMQEIASRLKRPGEIEVFNTHRSHKIPTEPNIVCNLPRASYKILATEPYKRNHSKNYNIGLSEYSDSWTTSHQMWWGIYFGVTSVDSQVKNRSYDEVFNLIYGLGETNIDVPYHYRRNGIGSFLSPQSSLHPFRISIAPSISLSTEPIHEALTFDEVAEQLQLESFHSNIAEMFFDWSTHSQQGKTSCKT